MKLTDTELELRDREWVESVVRDDEELLLVCKPQVRWKAEYVGRLIFAAVWLSLIGFASVTALPEMLEDVENKPQMLFFPLFLLPFWLVGIGLAVSPWWEQGLERRTVYVLTNTRAVVLKPSTWKRQRTLKGYVLVSDLIKEVVPRADGSGDIVFGYEERRSKNGIYYVPKGFLAVPQMERVLEMLRPLLPPAPEREEESESEPPDRPSYVELVVGLVFFIAGVAHVLYGAYRWYSGELCSGEMFKYVMAVFAGGMGASVVLKWWKKRKQAVQS